MVLVVGGSGLVGSHLLYELLKEHSKVRVLYRSEENKQEIKRVFSFYSQYPEDLFSKMEFVSGDILDYLSLFDALIGVTMVYHCAGLVSFAPQDAEKLKRVNIVGTANVVNACLENKVRKLCYVSSVAAIGKNKEKQFVDEETVWKASPENTVYSVTKNTAEREVWRGIQEGLSAVMVNPTIILGPGNWEKGSSALFRSARKGMKFYTPGITGFVDVRDLVKCMVKLMDSHITNERFIVNGENKQFRDFFTFANREFGNDAPFIAAPIWLSNWVWRLEKIRSFLTGSNPLITKETAISAHQKSYYSREKLDRSIDHSFVSFETSIKEISAFYKPSM